MSSPYPNAYQIEEIISSRDNPSVFNTYLADSGVFLSAIKN